MWKITKEDGYETVIKDAKCPFCGKEALLKKTYSMDGVSIDLYPSNYCPNCGAKLINPDKRKKMSNTNTYEEVLEACKNFNPDDVWVVTMEVYTYDLEENLNVDRWTLGYSKTREVASGYARYLHEAMCEKPYGYTAEDAFRFLCNRGLITDEAKKHQDYMYRIQDVDFKAERVKRIDIPEVK